MMLLAASVAEGRAAKVVTVSDTEAQTVTGFGAAAMWHLMAPMTDTEIINYLYGADSPVGLNIMRMELAPCLSGAWDQWTYNSWDKYVPVVKAAKAKGAIVFATPWSPPGEYKTNGYASGGEPDERGKLRDDCRSKFFTWLNSFLLYMSKQKAPVDIVSIQNEPDWWVSYSGCLYSPEEMTSLVADYGSTLKKNLYHVRLMGSESLNHNPDYARALLGNETARGLIDIIGGHIYGNRPLYNMKTTAELAAQHGKETWMTEHYIEGGDGSWTDYLRFAQEVNESMLAGANAYVCWYMIGPGTFCGDGRELETYPNNVWGQPNDMQCMAMAHFSKHLIGARRLVTTPEIAAAGEDLEYSAYVRGDSVIVEFVNMSSRTTAKLNLPWNVRSGQMFQSTENNLYARSTLTIATPTNSFNLVLPARSITTYVYTIDNGQPETALKLPENANPICPFLYTADPTAIEYEGRLYVYGTNDTEEFIAQGKQGGNTYGAIGTLAVFSTADMVNWTFHGLIPARELSGDWCGQSWAPSIVSRVEEDGQTHFYLYFSNNGSGVGVLTSTSPVGPWENPIKKALVDRNTPGVGNCSAPMDPGVVIDDEGTGWLAFGGGGPNSEGSEWMPGNARIVKLKPNLIEVDGSASVIPAPYHFEANELNIMNGKWVYTYCSTWAARDDWNKVGSTVAAPSLCSMDYMVSTDPLNPDSWKYAGEYFANPGTFGYPYYNNHTHLHKFLDQWYLIYHTNWLESVSPYDTGGFRCMAVSRANVRETLPRLNPVTANNKGVPQVQAMNPYELQQAETTSTGAGIEYENFFNASQMSNRLSHMPLVIGNIPDKAWTMVRGVDFGELGAQQFTAKLKGKGMLHVRLDDINAEDAAVISFSTAGWREQVAELDPLVFNGTHDVYFYFTDTRIAMFDEWQFTETVSTGIEHTEWGIENGANPSTTDASRVKVYDLTGRPVTLPTGAGNASGAGVPAIYIVRYPDGTTRKVTWR